MNWHDLAGFGFVIWNLYFAFCACTSRILMWHCVCVSWSTLCVCNFTIKGANKVGCWCQQNVCEILCHDIIRVGLARTVYIYLYQPLEATRGSAWFYVGRSVCKLAGLKAHTDHQNPNRVVFHGKTAAWVGLHPQPLHRFTPFLLQWYLFIMTPKHQTSLNLVLWLVRYSIWLCNK